jgi:hypothetical protein
MNSKDIFHQGGVAQLGTKTLSLVIFFIAIALVIKH